MCENVDESSDILEEFLVLNIFTAKKEYLDVYKIIKEKDCQKKLDLFIGTSLQKKIDYQKDKVELKTF